MKNLLVAVLITGLSSLAFAQSQRPAFLTEVVSDKSRYDDIGHETYKTIYNQDLTVYSVKKYYKDIDLYNLDAGFLRTIKPIEDEAHRLDEIRSDTNYLYVITAEASKRIPHMRACLKQQVDLIAKVQKSLDPRVRNSVRTINIDPAETLEVRGGLLVKKTARLAETAGPASIEPRDGYISLTTTASQKKCGLVTESAIFRAFNNAHNESLKAQAIEKQKALETAKAQEIQQQIANDVVIDTPTLN